MLTGAEIATFERDGYLALRGAVSPEVAEACATEIWQELDCDRHDPATWTEPVVRLWGFATPPFVEAANTTALVEAFDQLVGVGAWSPRTSLGTIPVRFPSKADPGDDGWHIEASFAADDGTMRVDLGSRGRALLLLFLFSDVGENDAPTRIRVGSHLDVPAHLVAAPSQEMNWMAICEAAVAASADREVHLATGGPGDVFLCHPFLVHAAQPHRGTRPRLMAQPPLEHARPFDLDQSSPPPVVRSILAGLRGTGGSGSGAGLSRP